MGSIISRVSVHKKYAPLPTPSQDLRGFNSHSAGTPWEQNGNLSLAVHFPPLHPATRPSMCGYTLYPSLQYSYWFSGGKRERERETSGGNLDDGGRGKGGGRFRQKTLTMSPRCQNLGLNFQSAIVKNNLSLPPRTAPLPLPGVFVSQGIHHASNLYFSSEAYWFLDTLMRNSSGTFCRMWHTMLKKLHSFHD